MIRIARRALLALLVVVAAARAAEDKRQFQNVVYPNPAPEFAKPDDQRRGREPRAWYRKTEPTYVRLAPPSLGGVAYYVLAGEPLKGELGAWAEGRLKRFNDTLNEDEIESDRTRIVKSESKPAKLHAMNAGVMVMQQIAEGDEQKPSKVRVGIGLSVKGDGGPRGEMVVLELPATKEAAKASGPFLKFVEALKFVSEGEPPLLPAPSAGPIDGLYYGTDQTFTTNGLQMETVFWFFSRDGRFYKGVPSGRAIFPLDWAALLHDEPDECGNYVVAGEKITLRFADGETDEETFKPGDEPTVGNVKLIPLKNVEPGGTLSGTFTSFNYVQLPQNSGTEGGVANTRTLTFSPAGEYILGSFTGASVTTENGGFSSTNKRPNEHGKYTIEGGLLTLTDAAGKLTKRSIIRVDDMLFLDGRPYLPEKKKQ